MTIFITPEESNVIDAIADFVEAQNTPGSGKRFALKFINAIERLAILTFNTGYARITYWRHYIILVVTLMTGLLHFV